MRLAREGERGGEEVRLVFEHEADGFGSALDVEVLDDDGSRHGDGREVRRTWEEEKGNRSKSLRQKCARLQRRSSHDWALAMASTTAEEQAYLDGTHPNLVGGNTTSSALERADSLSPPSSPAFKAIDNEPPTGPIPALNPPARGGGASNTGPKGVLADWRASNGMNAGAASNTGPKGVLADYHANGSGNVSGLMAGVGKMKVTQIRLEGEEEDDDGGEEEARERYRRQRVLEMSGSGSQVRRKTFGHLREIGVEQFLGAIEGEEEHVPVVLHLYEPVRPLPGSSARAISLTSIP